METSSATHAHGRVQAVVRRWADRPKRGLSVVIFGVAALAAVLAFWNVPIAASALPQTVRIGVLANRGEEKCRKDWGAMIQTLQNAQPNFEFLLVPLTFEAVDEAVDKAMVDFIVVNPAIYVNLEVTRDVIRIATLINRAAGRSSAKFGGVLFARAERADIQDFHQIKGKRLVATSPGSLGGWIMGWSTLLLAGIDPYRDASSLVFCAEHDKVVDSVLNGQADVGTVRTDTLERMVAEGKLRMADLKILTPPGFKPDPTFPFVYSTQLVPEWPFASLKHTPPALAKTVAATLLLMPSREDVVNAQGLQWTVPLPYESIHEILRELRVAPYEQFGKVRVGDFIEQNTLPVATLVALVVGLLMSVGYFRTLNQRLRVALRRLREAEIELTRQANTDGLTAMCNRKRFNEIVENEIGRALRYKRPLSMILLDLDHFKAINDKFGHPVGDEVLIAVAGRVSSTVRKGDVAARIGGEEFAVLLPETEINSAALLAERIRSEMAGAPLALCGHEPVNCTVSIGVADVCPSIQNHSALYTAVDEALYSAKRQGRNRVEKSSVCIFQPGGGTV